MPAAIDVMTSVSLIFEAHQTTFCTKVSLFARREQFKQCLAPCMQTPCFSTQATDLTTGRSLSWKKESGIANGIWHELGSAYHERSLAYQLAIQLAYQLAYPTMILPRVQKPIRNLVRNLYFQNILSKLTVFGNMLGLKNGKQYDNIVPNTVPNI